MGNNFLAESPNGVIKKKQFRSIMKILQPDMNMGKMEKNVFRMFDLDQDGEISIEEFLMLLQILQGGDGLRKQFTKNTLSNILHRNS